MMVGRTDAPPTINGAIDRLSYRVSGATITRAGTA
jgi:hypothetical protein